MAASADYAGRSVDLLVFRDTAPAGLRRVGTGFGAAGELTAGVQKLAQAWALLFLNRRPYGTGGHFLRALGLGGILDPSDVNSNFAFAAAAIAGLLPDGESIPDDERLEAAVLQSFSFDRESGRLNLTVKIRSRAGVERTFLLPTPVPIR